MAQRVGKATELPVATAPLGGVGPHPNPFSEMKKKEKTPGRAAGAGCFQHLLCSKYMHGRLGSLREVLRSTYTRRKSRLLNARDQVGVPSSSTVNLTTREGLIKGLTVTALINV